MQLSIHWILLVGLVCCLVRADIVMEDCEEEKTDCSATEYKSYVECIRRRIKRSTDCSYKQVETSCADTNDCVSSDTCGDCNCEYCSYNSCHSPCTSCCTKYDNCQDNRCCHKTCHAQCKSSACRTSCKRDCYESVNSGNISSDHSASSKNSNTHAQNITTIINLHNVINNTNLIDIPVNVTNINNNNITLDSQSSESSSILGGGSSTSHLTQGNCCNVVSPRQCVPSDKFPFVRCFHYRKKSCGPYCTAPTVHEQPHEVCDENPGGQPNCHQQIIYIPQPQPRCRSQSTWPYVNCGLGQQQPSCDGCYEHFTNGGSPPSNCPQECYDSGFNGPNFGQWSGGLGGLGGAGGSPWGGFGQNGFAQGAFGQGGFGAGNFRGYPFPLQGAGIAPQQLDQNFHIETDPAKKENEGDGNEEEEEDEDDEEGGYKKRSSDKNIVVENPPIAYSMFGFSPRVVTKRPEKVPKDISIGLTVVPKEAPSKYAVISIDHKDEKDEKANNDINRE